MNKTKAPNQFSLICNSIYILSSPTFSCKPVIRIVIYRIASGKTSASLIICKIIAMSGRKARA